MLSRAKSPDNATLGSEWYRGASYEWRSLHIASTAGYFYNERKWQDTGKELGPRSQRLWILRTGTTDAPRYQSHGMVPTRVIYRQGAGNSGFFFYFVFFWGTSVAAFLESTNHERNLKSNRSS